MEALAFILLLSWDCLILFLLFGLCKVTLDLINDFRDKKESTVYTVGFEWELRPIGLAIILMCLMVVALLNACIISEAVGAI